MPVVVGDGIPGCNARIGFLDALTFLRSVKRHHLLNFFFITKWRIPWKARFLNMFQY